MFSPKFLKQLHLILAWAWLLFGIWGALRFGIKSLKFGPALAQSIPVLFFISVYANFIGHVSSAQAADVEIEE